MTDSMPIPAHECTQAVALNALRREDTRIAAELVELDNARETAELKLGGQLSRMWGEINAVHATNDEIKRDIAEVKVSVGVIARIVTERVDPILELAQKQSTPPAPASDTPATPDYFDLDGLGANTRQDIMRPDRLARRAKSAESALTERTAALEAAIQHASRLRVGRNWERAALGALVFVSLAQQLGLWAALHRAVVALFGG